MSAMYLLLMVEKRECNGNTLKARGPAAGFILILENNNNSGHWKKFFLFLLDRRGAGI